MPPEFTPDFRESLAALLTWRRDVRRFRRDAIDAADVADLLEVAQKAPSVGNSQPWRFVRIRSPELRETLATHVDGEVTDAGGKLYDQAKRDAYGRLKLHGLREAPEILAVFCDDGTTIGSNLGAATMPETRVYSVVLAIHTLWLAARARGIALGWVSIVDPGFVCRLLDAAPHWRLVAVLCLGRPETSGDTPELERAGWQARHDWRVNVSER